jgi:hypothetical protein
MSIRSIALLCSLILFSQNLFADNLCPNALPKDKTIKAVDLRLEMGPLRDQDSIGWCYGFTSADLLTHYLYKTQAREVIRPDKNADYQSSKFAVSAVGMSTFFNKMMKKDFLKGVVAKDSNELAMKYKKNVVAESGLIVEALNIAKISGFCFEKDLPSENFGYVQDNRCAQNGKCNLEEMLKIVFDEADVKNCISFTKIQKLFPNLTTRTINTILLFTEKENAINRLAAVACKKRFSSSFFQEAQPVIKNETLNDPKNPKFDSKYQSRTPLELLMTAEEALDKGTPAGIIYFADFLLNPNAKQSSPHASSLVGKYFNPKTCEVEYILRNSWGNSCDIYNVENPNYAKCTNDTRSIANPEIVYAKMHTCREANPPIARNPNVRCDSRSGYAYVKKSDLLKNIYGTTYIKEK